MTQSDFEDTISRFSKLEDARDRLWHNARKMLLNGYEREDDLVELVGGKIITAQKDNQPVTAIPFAFEIDLKRKKARYKK